MPKRSEHDGGLLARDGVRDGEDSSATVSSSSFGFRLKSSLPLPKSIPPMSAAARADRTASARPRPERRAWIDSHQQPVSVPRPTVAERLRVSIHHHSWRLPSVCFFIWGFLFLFRAGVPGASACACVCCFGVGALVAVLVLLRCWCWCCCPCWPWCWPCGGVLLVGFPVRVSVLAVVLGMDI